MKIATVKERNGLAMNGAVGESESGDLARARRWTAFAVVSFLSLAVLSCAAMHDQTYSWREEVLLSSGEQVTLKRTAHFTKRSEPGNPLRFSWAKEDSTLTVDAGPPDLIRASFLLKDWIGPMILDRDPQSQRLVLVGAAHNCDWVARFGHKPRGIYIAFVLTPGREAEAVDFPVWAWNRPSNLYLATYEIYPPRTVTPAETERHNAQDARMHRILRVVDPTFKAGCG